MPLPSNRTSCTNLPAHTLDCCEAQGRLPAARMQHRKHKPRQGTTRANRECREQMMGKPLSPASCILHLGEGLTLDPFLCPHSLGLSPCLHGLRWLHRVDVKMAGRRKSAWSSARLCLVGVARMSYRNNIKEEGFIFGLCQPQQEKHRVECTAKMVHIMSYWAVEKTRPEPRAD